MTRHSRNVKNKTCQRADKSSHGINSHLEYNNVCMCAYTYMAIAEYNNVYIYTHRMVIEVLYTPRQTEGYLETAVVPKGAPSTTTHE